MPALLKTHPVIPEGQQFSLFSLPPSRAQYRLAVAVVVGVVAAYFIAVGLLSDIPPHPLPAYIHMQIVWQFLNYALTAILLFAQFSILRARGILVIASGYLFSALIVILWGLTFPGVFGQPTLIGGLQSTLWLYVFWHAGFPIFVFGYALVKDSHRDRRLRRGSPGTEIFTSVAATAVAVSVVAMVCIAGEALLPRVMLDSARFGPLYPVAAIPITFTSVSALIALWLRRRSMLDLWLMVVMCLFAFTQVTYLFTPARFSAGWYVISCSGIISGSVVLICLLYELIKLYGRILAAVFAQRREREARLMTGNAVAASVAHEVRQPLTAMVTTADAGLRFLDRSTPNLDKAKEAFRNIAADGHRAGAVIANIRANFKTDVRDRTSFDLNKLIHEAVALEHGDLQKHRILVQVEPSERLPEVRGNRVQLQQVLLNLISNAVEAMAVKDEPRILLVKSEVHGGAEVVVSVADTGPGIGSQDADRIFNPLFTTKSDGMGMGLSICRAIIEAHEGRLWVTRNTPQGAVFQFTLRATSAATAGT